MTLREKPCPFCGCSAQHVETDGASIAVTCDACGASGPHTTDRKMSEELWYNRVTQSTDVVKESPTFVDHGYLAGERAEKREREANALGSQTLPADKGEHTDADVLWNYTSEVNARLTKLTSEFYTFKINTTSALWVLFGGGILLTVAVLWLCVNL